MNATTPRSMEEMMWTVEQLHSVRFGSKLIAAAGILLWAGCEETTVCTTLHSPAVAVVIHDAATGDNLAVGSTIVAVDGAYRDSLVATSPPLATNTDLVNIADERIGTY